MTLQVETAPTSSLEVEDDELGEQAAAMEQQLGQLLTHIEKAIAEQQAGEEEDGEKEPWASPPEEEPRLSPEDEARVEKLFRQAQENRSKAYELKRELDRLEVFKDYEDRFLDLFKRTNGQESRKAG